MISKGRYRIPVSGKVSLSDIRSRSRGDLYEKGSDGSYHLAGSMVPVGDIPSYADYEDEAVVDLAIDDHPFNRSVAQCCSEVEELSSEVDSLTSSVNIGAAGIAGAKAAAALQIGRSLSKGFGDYIRYLIREKMTLLKAKLPGLALTIDATGKQLSDRQNVLERDYQQITARYSKIMVQLRENLEKRLRELDRDAFAICKIINDEVFVDPMGAAFGQSVCSGPEQLTAADSVKIVQVKTNALEAMRKIEEQVIELRRLKGAITDILTDHESGTQERFAMPALRMEGDGLDSEEKDMRIVFPDDFAEKDSVPVRAKVAQGFSALPPMRKSDRECVEVDRYFQRHMSSWMVEHQDADPRVAEFIRRMWDDNKAKLSN